VTSNLFTNQWRRQYLVSLREVHSSNSKSSAVKSVKVGDIVILRDELTKRAFWRLGVVIELLTGISDNIARAAIVKTVNSEKTQLLRRSIKHLIPVELNTSLQVVDDSAKAATNEKNQDPPSCSTQTRRRAAAIMGEKQKTT